MNKLLATILVVSMGGLAFSGYLTYRELSSSGSTEACTALGEPGGLLGAPPCVYGLVMYLVIAVLTSIALRRRRGRRGGLP
jgi:uncharacterized membrane protein